VFRAPLWAGRRESRKGLPVSSWSANPSVPPTNNRGVVMQTMSGIAWVPVLTLKAAGKFYEERLPASLSHGEAWAVARERFDADSLVVAMSVRRVLGEQEVTA